RLDSPHSLKHLAETWTDLLRPRLGNWSGVEGLLEDLVQRLPHVECLYYIEAEGGRTALVINRQILGEREVPVAVKEGVGFTDRPWYKAAVAQGATILTTPFESILSHERILT